MRQERIISTTQAAAPVTERAVIRYVKILKRNTARLPRLYEYAIEGPPGRRFFPSDESLRTLISTIPRMRIRRIERYPDHDLLIVFGLAHNVLSKRATSYDRSIRRGFLSDFGSIAEPYRDVPSFVQEAMDAFLARFKIDILEWRERPRVKGRTRRWVKPKKEKARAKSYELIATRSRFPGRKSTTYTSTSGGTTLLDISLRALARLCEGTLPFHYDIERKYKV